jgi:nucleoside-diphosphate-sugar epimerase
MIIGSGFIAKNFKKKKKLIKNYNLAIYASGVSNSKSTNKYNFKRERKKIINYKKKVGYKIFVYISTCSIFDPSRQKNLYVKHKLNMENLIKKNFNKYIIVRFPEVIGLNSNKNNLINFFYQKIINNEKFKLWSNSKRNIIDIDDAIKIFFIFIKKIWKKKKINLEVNIANTKFVSPNTIVRIIEKLTLKKACYDKIEFGHLNWKIRPLINKSIIETSRINFDRFYLEKILKKYY